MIIGECDNKMIQKDNHFDYLFKVIKILCYSPVKIFQSNQFQFNSAAKFCHNAFISIIFKVQGKMISIKGSIFVQQICYYIKINFR